MSFEMILLDKIRELETLVREEPLAKSCANCDNWDHTADRCRKFDSVPPPRVLFIGCAEHMYDIPF